jgi:hypothetical protein
MNIDDRFLEWLSKENLAEHVGDKIIHRALYKWYGFIIENVSNLDRKKHNIQYLSVFIEFYERWLDTLDHSQRSSVPQTGDILAKLNQNIRNNSDKRSRVVSKWYNYETKCFEVELEDGNYVATGSGDDIYPSQGLVDSLFESIFKRITNPSLFRDEQIKKIFN